MSNQQLAEEIISETIDVVNLLLEHEIITEPSFYMGGSVNVYDDTTVTVLQGNGNPYARWSKDHNGPAISFGNNKLYMYEYVKQIPELHAHISKVFAALLAMQY